MRAADSPRFLVAGPVLSGFAAHVADRLHARNPEVSLAGATAEDVEDLRQFRTVLAEVAQVWTDMPAWPKVLGAVVVDYPAAVTDQLFARHLPGLLADPRLDRRAELEAVRAAVRREAIRWHAGRGGAAISAETPAAVPAPRWPEDEWITIEEAAVLLERTPRRARQLAAAGLGVKNGTTWLLHRAGLLAHLDEHRSTP